MKRREFLKGVAASAAGAASANATSVISDDLMNSEDAPITASHFGAVRALRRNGKFEGVLSASELDFFPGQSYSGNRSTHIRCYTHRATLRTKRLSRKRLAERQKHARQGRVDRD